MVCCSYERGCFKFVVRRGMIVEKCGFTVRMDKGLGNGYFVDYLPMFMTRVE